MRRFKTWGCLVTLLVPVFLSCGKPTDGNVQLNVDQSGLSLVKGPLRFGLDQRGNPTILFQERTLLAEQGAGSLPLNHLVIDGSEVTGFELDPASVRTESVAGDHGPGTRLRASFTARVTPEVSVRQNLAVDFPDRHPGLAVLNVSYDNLSDSKSLQVGKVVTGHLRLDASRTAPGDPPYAFHTFQGGSYEWGRSYAGIPITPDFDQPNFMGLYTRAGFDQKEDEGGGINLVDVWNRTLGVAVCHLATKDLFVSFPTWTGEDGRVNIAMTEEPDAALGDQTVIEPGGSYVVRAPVGLILHHGDYFEPLRVYRDLLKEEGIAVQESSPAWTYQSYWKTWGWKRDFTLQMVYDRIPQLLELGIRQLQIDDGWQDFVGDWNPNRTKYPNGEIDVIASVRKMKDLGIERVYLWWNPLGVDPGSEMAKRTEWLVLGQDLKPASTRQHTLCPAYPPVQEHIRSLVRKWITEWGYDGVYNDFAMNSVAPACFNPAHHHTHPTDSFSATPLIWSIIWDEAHKVHRDPFLETCICSLPHSLFKNPFTNMTSASDPLTNRQVRARIKVEKATHGPRWAYSNCYIEEGRRDPLPQLSDADFASSVGIGAILTTMYAQLSEQEFAQYKKWFGIYFRELVSAGDYLNLYDIVYDRPEAHVIRKDASLYYGFYSDDRWDGQIELRGLDAREYEVLDYVEGRQLGTVTGTTGRLQAGFDHYLLLKCTPR